MLPPNQGDITFYLLYMDLLLCIILCYIISLPVYIPTVNVHFIIQTFTHMTYKSFICHHVNHDTFKNDQL